MLWYRPSVRLSVRLFPLYLLNRHLELEFVYVCVDGGGWVMTIARLELKVKVIGQRQRSMSNAHDGGNAATRSIWPRSSIADSFSSVNNDDGDCFSRLPRCTTLGYRWYYHTVSRRDTEAAMQWSVNGQQRAGGHRGGVPAQIRDKNKERWTRFVRHRQPPQKHVRHIANE